MKKFTYGLLAAAILGAFQTHPVSACTDFRLTAKDGTILIARSMEFGSPLNSSIRSATRNQAFSSTAPEGKQGLKWKAAYGYVYLDGFGQNIALDGMNEAGLTFESLYLPGETTYQTVPQGKSSQALSYDMFGDWVLGNFKTIDEVKKALDSVYIFPRTLPGLGSMILQAHASIYDASGKGIVVEFINGKAMVYDNIGIMTNSPQYPWHITNLRNYLNLSPNNPNPISADGMVFSSLGQGAGSVGLPGDSSPPSRFVKIAFMTKNVYVPNNAVDTLNIAQHIMNNVDLPAGFSRTTNNGVTATDTTQWVIFKDITHKMLYYKTYGDLSLRSIDFSKVDFSENAPHLNLALGQAQTVVDMTDAFIKTGVIKPAN